MQPSGDSQAGLGEVTDPVFSVFVSYETNTGLAYARRLKAGLRVAGLGAWIWHDDRTIGEVRDEEITQKIFDLPHFVYICTENSHESEGQKEERGLARSLGRVAVVVELAGSFVSPLYLGRNRIRTTPAHFERACDEVAREILRREQVLVGTGDVEPVGDADVKEEGQPLEPA